MPNAGREKVQFKFEPFLAATRLTNVNWLRTILILLLAALWAPVSIHCQLEQLPALEFLSCCSHDAAEDSHSGKGCAEDDCATDACSVVESGFYKIEDHGVLVAPAGFNLSTTPAWLEPLLPAESSSASASLPESQHLPSHVRPWQFSTRTALPARAPDSAS